MDFFSTLMKLQKVEVSVSGSSPASTKEEVILYEIWLVQEIMRWPSILKLNV